MAPCLGPCGFTGESDRTSEDEIIPTVHDLSANGRGENTVQLIYDANITQVIKPDKDL